MFYGLKARVVNSKWQDFQAMEDDEHELEGLMLTAPLCKPFPLLQHGTRCNVYLEDNRPRDFVQRKKQMLVRKGYTATSTYGFSWLELFQERSKTGFQVMPCPTSFICEKYFDRSPSLFSRNNVEIAILARQLEEHSK